MAAAGVEIPLLKWAGGISTPAAVKQPIITIPYAPKRIPLPPSLQLQTGRSNQVDAA